MTGLKNGTWVVIADGEKALLAENITDAENPNLRIVRTVAQDNPKTMDQSTDRPGRMADTGPGHRSAMEDTDWHELAKERFADELADLLYGYSKKGAFDHVVLVAPPKTLGELREKLHQEVAAKVVGEIDKTLTNHPLNEIADIVKTDLASG